MRLKRASLLVSLLLVALGGCSDDDNVGNDNQTDAGVDATTDATDAGPEGLMLELGELASVEPDENGTADVTLVTPYGDEEFLVMIQSRATSVNTLHGYTGALPRQKSAHHAALDTTPDERLRRWGCLSAGGRLDLAEVVGRLEGRPVPRGVLTPLPPPLPPPNVGDMVEFDIDSNSGLVTVTAEVLLVSASLVVALDRTTDPTLELDATKLDEVATGFEDIVLPRERIFFGQESDVNADGHVTVLFSPLVADVATAYVNPYDLITDPAARPAGVAANDQELIYVSPPQLLDPHMGTANAIIETLAHEFQHAIYFHHKYQLNDIVGDPESAYITEGLSALAQDLTGYQAGNWFVATAGLDEIDDVSVNDLIASGGFYILDRDGALRGSAYNLLRYLYDQAGGDTVLPNGDVDTANSPGIAWLRAYVDSPLLGVANLEAATGQTLVDVATDWYTAQMVDDRLDALDAPLNTDPRYNYRETSVDPLTGRTRGMTMFDSWMGMVTRAGPLVREFADSDGAIREGGVDYLHLVATSTPTTSFVIAADAEDVDPFLVLFRVR